MKVRVGTWVAPSVAPHVESGFGFSPKLVLIQGVGSVRVLGLKTTSMPTFLYTTFEGFSTGTTVLNGVTLDADGFTVGQSALGFTFTGQVNYFIALDDDPAVLNVGSYVGTGFSRTIGGLPFDPDWVGVSIDDVSGRNVFQKHPAFAASRGWFSASTDPVTNAITGLVSGGFDLGVNPSVNAVGVTYHYWALKDTPGNVKIASFLGDGSGNKSIINVGFQPEYGLTSRLDPTSTTSFHKMSSMAGFLSFRPRVLGVGGVPNSAGNLWRSFDSDGFTVGTSFNVSGISQSYVVFANALPSGSGGIMGGSPATKQITKADVLAAREHAKTIGARVKTKFDQRKR